MPLVNRCWFRAGTSALSDFTVASALTGYYTPAQCQNPFLIDGGTYRYVATSDDETQHEEGEGDNTAGIQARTTIFSSSNGGAKVNFSAAPKVMLTDLAQDFGLAVNTTPIVGGIDGSFLFQDNSGLLSESNFSGPEQALRLQISGPVPGVNAPVVMLVSSDGPGSPVHFGITSGSADYGGTFTLRAGDGSGADGGEFVMRSGDSAAADGGVFNLTAGNGAVTGGNFFFQAGLGATGGDFNIIAGISSGAAAVGGNFIMAAGGSVGSGATVGGGFTMTAGDAVTGGNFTLSAGDGSTTGGNINLTAGTGPTPGTINLTGEVNGTGDVNVTGGNRPFR